MKVGDFVTAVSHVDVKWSKHDDVVQKIRASGSHIVLQLVTPCDKDYLHPDQVDNSKSPVSSPVPGDTTIDRRQREKSRGIWTLRRRSKSREKKSNKSLAANGDVVGMRSK